MSPPTSVEFLPKRLESLGVSAPKTKQAKRIKTIHVPSEPEPPVITCTNLRDLPSELMVEVIDDSKLYRVLDGHLTSNRQNSGNSGAVGRTSEELAVYSDTFESILGQYEKKRVFLVKDDSGTGDATPAVVKKAKKMGWPVFATYTFEGVRERLKKQDALSIYRWNKGFPETSTRQTNVIKIDGYVACILWAKLKK